MNADEYLRYLDSQCGGPVAPADALDFDKAVSHWERRPFGESDRPLAGDRLYQAAKEIFLDPPKQYEMKL